MLLLFDTCDDISQSLELDERFIKGLDAGLSIDLVKDNVTTLTKRSIQQWLRDPDRNQSFFQSVNLMISFLEFDCNAKSRKQEAKNMLFEECARLYNGHRWKQLGRVQYREACAREKLIFRFLGWCSSFNCGDHPSLDEWHCDIFSSYNPRRVASPPCLESKGCHLISPCYLLSCFSA